MGGAESMKRIVVLQLVHQVVNELVVGSNAVGER